MRVIVCGAGRVGYSIARRLSQQRNDVTVIDQSIELVQNTTEMLDVQGIVGFASSPDILDKAKASDADMIVAVTLSDEVNMIACQVAHSLFNIPTKIARVRNQSYLGAEWADLFSRDNLPIDVIISPEVEIAAAIRRRIELPGASDIMPFVDDAVSVVGVNIDEDCPVVDTPLRQLETLFPDLDLTVMGIIRGDKVLTVAADDMMLIGDKAYFSCAREQMERALSVFGKDVKRGGRMVLMGGGNVGYFLGDDLSKRGFAKNVSILEHDRGRAERLAQLLPDITVLHGSALDSELLDEVGVGSAERVICVTNDDEVNILASLLAKRLGAKKSMALINNQTFRPLLSQLGLDVVIDPREITVSRILGEIRRGRIRSVHSLADGRAEVLEAEALETSALVGKTISKAKLPDGIRIGSIYRSGKVMSVRSNTVIEPKDRVVIFALADMVRKVEQMFAVRLEYF
ncbi:MAG: Trk system potassium transporter TrkA [Pseudomonadota bacterium]